MEKRNAMVVAGDADDLQLIEVDAADDDDGVLAGVRHARISLTAYLRSEARGFEPGRELEDWLEAEREVDGAHARAMA